MSHLLFDCRWQTTNWMLILYCFEIIQFYGPLRIAETFTRSESDWVVFTAHKVYQRHKYIKAMGQSWVEFSLLTGSVGHWCVCDWNVKLISKCLSQSDIKHTRARSQDENNRDTHNKAILRAWAIAINCKSWHVSNLKNT